MLLFSGQSIFGVPMGTEFGWPLFPRIADMDNRTSNTSGGASGSGGVSSSFTSSAGVTSSTFDDDDGEGNEASSDYEDLSSSAASQRTRRTGFGGSGEVRNEGFHKPSGVLEKVFIE